MMVNLEEITPNAEKKITRIARVSNPQNQNNADYASLLRYCVKHQHWSIFEHAHMTLEIVTSLAVAAQILRHRSFTFQQLSARYQNPFSVALDFENIELRKQAEKNRQSSEGFLDGEIAEELEQDINLFLFSAEALYKKLIAAGVARECARMVLPQTTKTRLYMTGNMRSWIHYIELRTKPETQSEHRAVALEAKKLFRKEMPTIAEALEW